MDTKLKYGRPVQRIVYAAVIIAVFDLLLLDQTSARFLDDECKGVMGNRELYEYVHRVCDDCSNIYRGENILTKCRKNCFYNPDFASCVLTLERQEEFDQFNKAMSVLSAGRK